jgi:cytochrome c556
MKKLSSGLALPGIAFAVVLLLAACGPGGGGEAVDDSPEGLAFQARQGLMRMIQWKMVRLNGMEQGDIPVDEAVFKETASDVASLSGMLTDGFIPNSNVQGSAALPDIWTNWEDFEEKAENMQSAAAALAMAAESGGFAAGRSLVPELRQTCGGCHRGYRRRAEE